LVLAARHLQGALVLEEAWRFHLPLRLRCLLLQVAVALAMHQDGVVAAAGVCCMVLLDLLRRRLYTQSPLAAAALNQIQAPLGATRLYLEPVLPRPRLAGVAGVVVRESTSRQAMVVLVAARVVTTKVFLGVAVQPHRVIQAG
jgi:hypothetical protein